MLFFFDGFRSLPLFIMLCLHFGFAIVVVDIRGGNHLLGKCEDVRIYL